MNDIKAFSIVSSEFVSPLFPSKGEDVKLSVAFSSAPDAVYIKYDTDMGLVFMKEMEKDGEVNGAVKFSQTVPVTTDGEKFRWFFVFFKDNKSYYVGKKGITRYTPGQSDQNGLPPLLVIRYSLIDSVTETQGLAQKKGSMSLTGALSLLQSGQMNQKIGMRVDAVTSTTET